MHALWRKTHNRAFRSRECQSVVDEMHQPPGFAHDYVGCIAPFVIGSSSIQRKRFAEQQYLRERRSQFMRDARAEFQTQPGKLLLTLQVAHYDHCEEAC